MVAQENSRHGQQTWPCYIYYYLFKIVELVDMGQFCTLNETFRKNNNNEGKKEYEYKV